MSHFSVSLPVIIFVMQLVSIFNHKLRKMTDLDAFVRSFMNFQFFTFLSSRFLFFWLYEQVYEFFVVEFEETCTYQILFVLACSFNVLKNEIDGSRNDSTKVVWTLFSLHCEGFSCSCLPISKNCSIVALHNTLDNRQGRKLKY